jgi:hypothetical protein
MQKFGVFPFSRSGFRIAIFLAVLLVSCESLYESPDFERHRYSQLIESFDRSDVIYFDVKFSPNFPDGDPVAEAKRMDWLSGWLVQRKMCPYGYDILKRRPFGMLEDNPARYDIRYEIKCKLQTDQ